MPKSIQNINSDNSGDDQPILPMDYQNQDGHQGRFVGGMNAEVDDIDGLVMDAIRGQEEEYGDDAEDYYDEEELDLQEQDYDQQLTGPPDGRPGLSVHPDRPYVDEEFDQIDQEQ